MGSLPPDRGGFSPGGERNLPARACRRSIFRFRIVGEIIHGLARDHELGASM